MAEQDRPEYDAPPPAYEERQGPYPTFPVPQQSATDEKQRLYLQAQGIPANYVASATHPALRAASPRSSATESQLQGSLTAVDNSNSPDVISTVRRELIVIPQRLASGRERSQIHMPFETGYPVKLGLFAHPISKEEYRGFIESINVALKSNSTLDVLSTTGFVITHIPLPLVKGIIGGGLKAASDASNAALSRSSLNTKLQQANVNLFFPRQMRAQILRTKELEQMHRDALEEDVVDSDHDDPEDSPTEASSTASFDSHRPRSESTAESPRVSRCEMKRQSRLARAEHKREWRAARAERRRERKHGKKTQWSAYARDGQGGETDERVWLVISSIEMGSGNGEGSSKN